MDSRIKKPDYFKILTGKTFEEQVRIPSVQSTLDQYHKGLKSVDDPFLLGYGTDGYEVYVSEQERESHIHVIGGPGSGKSKFLEYLCRHDITRLHEDALRGIRPKDGRSCGMCFLDPSEDGDTINKILAYCAEIGFEKVLLIDPLRYHSHQKLPAVNPFKEFKTYWAESVEYLVDAFRVVYEVEDISRTSYIKTYLTAIFSLFHYASLTGSDLLAFTTPPNKQGDKNPVPELAAFEARRRHTFELTEKAIEDVNFPGIWRDIARKHLADVQHGFRSIPNFQNEVGSTVRRLNTLVSNPYLKFIYGHRDGVDFDDLVSNGWIILVNVSTGSGLGTLEARLLGTIIINQIISSIKRIRRKGFNKPYYLYIDEAGQYVTHTLADILAHKRKIGLRCVLAHQHLGQLRDTLVREAIVNCTGIKCGFYIEHPPEREEVMKMLGYGGELSPKDVAFNLSFQQKQTMVLRLGKTSPTLVKVPDVPDSTGDVGKLIDTLFKDPRYFTLKDIKDDEAKRFKAVSSKNNQSPQSPKAAHGPTTGKAPVPKRGAKTGVQPNSKTTGKNGGRGPLSI